MKKHDMTSAKRARICGQIVTFNTIKTRNGFKTTSDMSQLVLLSETYFYYIALNFDIHDYFKFRKISKFHENYLTSKTTPVLTKSIVRHYIKVFEISQPKRS